MLKVQYPVDYLKKESTHSEVEQVDWQRRPVLKRSKRVGDLVNDPRESTSFVSATLGGTYNYWLMQADIAGIARTTYGWHGEDNNVIFDVIGSIEHLGVQLEQHKDKLRQPDRRSLTFVYNLGGNHWTTLVIAYQGNQFSAYYIDSLGNGIPNDVRSVLEEKVAGITIYPFNIRQQTDGHNCGIFALENAKIINDALQTGQQGQIEQGLSNYKPTEEQLINRRIEFAENLGERGADILGSGSVDAINGKNTDEVPQRSELLERLIEEMTAGTPAQQKGRLDQSFEARFRSFIHKIPSVLHSVMKKGFFPHFFLGGFSTLLDTQIAKKLNIKKIYFRFDTAETLKVVVIKNGQIRSAEDITNNINLFSISEGKHGHQFTSGELEKILQENIESGGLTEQDIKKEVKDRVKSRLVRISKEKDGIFVKTEVKEMLDSAASQEFHEIEKGLWDNPEGDIAQLAHHNKEIVSEFYEKTFKKIRDVHSKYKDSFKYGKEAREAAHHGFITGVFMNFRYRYHIRIGLEKLEGGGYSDIKLQVRGVDNSPDSFSTYIEVKASPPKELKKLKRGEVIEDSSTSPEAALEQAMGYAKGSRENSLAFGVNLDYPSPISDVVVVNQEEKVVPLLEGVLEFADGWNKGELDEKVLKTRIQNNIKDIHHKFPGTSEKRNHHYFSRFLLGQSILLNKVEALETEFEKHIFIYGENIPTEIRLKGKDRDVPQREAAKEADEKLAELAVFDESHAVVTMVLIPKDTEEPIYVMHIVEADREVVLNKKLPLDELGGEIKDRGIVELTLNFNVVLKGRGAKSQFEKRFSMDANKYYSLEHYNGVGNGVFQGAFKEMPYPDELQEAFGEAIDSKLIDAQDQPALVDKYDELFKKIGEGIFPCKFLIESESHTQAVIDGLFQYYRDLRLSEVSVSTEFQLGGGKRIDMLICVGRVCVGIEVKGPRGNVGVGALGREAGIQISGYAEGDYSITGAKKVFLRGYIFDTRATDASSIVVRVNDEVGSPLEEIVEVIYSSQEYEVSVDEQPTRKRQKTSEFQVGCSSSKRRKTRSTGESCIDSRDEESAEEKKGKEELIKELFDSDKIRERIKNVEFYDQLFKVSEQISKGEIIDPSIEEALIAKIKNIDLDSIDPEIKDIVEGIKEKISKPGIHKALKDIFKGPGVTEKIGKVAEGAGLARTVFLAKNNKIQEYVDKINSNPEVMNHLNRIGKISGGIMQGMMYKNLIDDIFSGNYKGVAINLGFIVGSPFLGKLAEVASARGIRFTSEGKVILGRALETASPFIARATSAFIVYDLVNQVKELEAGNKDALVGVVGDGIYLGVDVVEVGVELAEFAGILEGVSSVAGPIGAAIGVLVLVGTDIYLAVRTVEQEDKIIHLTGWEKFKEGWRALLHVPPEQYMEELIGEKEANNQLVKSSIALLKRNTDIQRYVFPTGKSVVDSCRTIEKREELCSKGSPMNGVCPMGTGIYKTYKHEKCNTKIQLDLESSVSFSEKRDIFPSRASPDNPEEGELFCLPPNTSPRCDSIDILDVRWGDCRSSNGYYCNSAIGVSYTKDRTGNYTLIALDKGKDIAVGFKGSPNIFLVEDGEKWFFGGDGDDIFVLSGSKITGVLDGVSGDNTIDFGGFRVEQESLVIDSRSSIDGLEWINMNNILGREGRKDSIYCDKNTKYIDGRGGKGKNALDNVILRSCRTLDHSELTIVVKPYTYVENPLLQGNFTYVVHQGQGNSLINIEGRGKHSFLFNYTLQNIETVSSSGEVVFTFSSSLNLNVSIGKASYSDISYTLSDGTEIRMDKNGIFALQSTNKSVDEIIKDYPAIANRLNMTIIVQSRNESIIVGHGKHEVLHNDPEFNSHLVGNGGENVYVIAPTQKEINIYDVDEESSIDTLNLRNVIEEAQNASLKVSQSENDLLIKLEGGESLLKFPIRIKNGTLWHEKLHVVGDSMPMQIKHSDNTWNLGLGPLTFDDNIKIAVITAKDVGEGNELIVRKQAGQYAFSRLRDDLIIITDPSLGESNACTILLSNFYKEPKMKTLSIKFEDTTISLQNKMREIGEAVAFCPRVLQINKEFSVDGSNLLSRYDCLKFNSDEMLFLRLGNSLLLLSDKGKLLMSDYYSDVHEKWNLPVELNDDIITSEKFKKRAENASPFRYYQPGEEGLEIYHNQPTNKHQVGLMDLKSRSILDCSVEIIDEDLNLSFGGKAIATVKNWSAEASAREMMFAFNDTVVYNAKCIVSNCGPEDIVEEFGKEKAGLVSEYNSSLLDAAGNGDLGQVTDLLSRGANVNAKDGGGRTPLHYAAVNNNLEVAKLLTERGANVSARANDEKTPLDLARPGSKVENFLEKKQRKRLIQRRRRHHHGDHPRRHDREQREQKYLQEGERPIHLKSKGASRSIENDNSTIESNRATSAASKPSSWINVFANTVAGAIKGISQFISSPFKPAIDMEHSQPSKAITAQGTDVNGTLLLLDVFIRKITGQKYISNNIRSISEQEAQIYALPIAKEFEQALESAAVKSGIPVTNLKFNPVEVFLKMVGQVRSGKFSEISKTLYSSAKEACPGFEQTGEFLVHVKSHLEKFLAEKETVFLQQKQTADQPTSSVSRKVVAMEPSKEPDTFLSNTSVAKGIKHVLGL